MGGCGHGVGLGKVGGEEAIIRIYAMRKDLCMFLFTANGDHQRESKNLTQGDDHWIVGSSASVALSLSWLLFYGSGNMTEGPEGVRSRRPGSQL